LHGSPFASPPSTASTPSARAGLFGLGDRAVGRLAHAQIAISHGLARYLARTEGFSESSFEVIHYGIAVEALGARARGAEPRFLSVGRLIPIKGHDVLLRAFARVLDRRPDARLAIAGHGQLEQELRSLSASLGLEGAVSFLGQVSPAQALIEEASVVVVPSRGEGFGMVALEAMERGRPVVATAVGGLGDLVRDGVTGLLVPAEDAEALAAAMLALADDPARAEAMGAAGRVRALEAFEQARCTDRTEALYRSWLERRGLQARRGGGATG
jgi:glycosyltransferase involved in cell wall biosynthesis